MDALIQPIRCRCCGEPVATAEQKVWSGGSYTILTCRNARDKCDLCGHTFALKDYWTLDLSKYKWRDESWKHRERIDRI